MQESQGPFQESSSNVSLREYGDILRRRRAIILQTFVIVLVAGVLVTLFATNVYQARSRMLLEPTGFFINQVNTTDPLADLFLISQPYSVMTQVEMLQSAEIRERVAKSLNATNMPALSVKPIEGTSIIEISSEGSLPETVASAPNKLMEIFVEDTAKKNSENMDGALTFAKNQSKLYQNKVENLERQIRQFKTQNDLIELGANKADQMGKVVGMENSLRDAENNLEILRLRLAETKKKMDEMRAQGRDQRSDLTSPMADQGVQSLDERIYQIQTQLIGYATRYVDTIQLNPNDLRKANSIDTLDPKNTKAVKEAQEALERIRKEIKDWNKKIATNEDAKVATDPALPVIVAELMRSLDRKWELTKNFKDRSARIDPIFQTFRDSMDQDLLSASLLTQQINQLRSQLQTARKRLVQFPQWEQDYTALQREYASAMNSLAYYQDKISILSLRKEASASRKPVRILQTATPPTEPVKPKKAQNILFAGLLGLFFGLCLALLQELFDDRINSPEEAERSLRLPNLGHIPLIEEEGLRLIKDISTFSPLMEAYRTLRTNINFAAVGNEVRSIVITSSVPAEGKSTTVANLAMAMALDSKSVIIVDADLRRPSMHKLFKLDSSPGLTDVLVGTHSIEEVIRPIPGVQNVSVIPAGSPPPNPSELLGSAAMGQLLAKLEGMADVVLFDSPPSLAVADSIVLSSRTNGVLLVIAYGETKKTSTKKAIEILSRANANVLGTVLNRMEGPAGGYYYGRYYVPASERASSDNGSGGAKALEEPRDALTEKGDTETTLTDTQEERKS
jgi:capsular exopolysaccharide synthesis family protein